MIHPLGVHSHLFRGPPAAVAEACRRNGLTCVQLTPNFPGLIFQEPGQITPERCRRAAEPFRDAGIQIAALAASTNLMDPDLGRRHRGIIRLHALIRHCRDFGTDRVITETGSLSPKSPWLPYGPNRSRAAWTELRLIVSEALAVAAEHGVTLLLKADPVQVLATVEDAVRLRHELDHPNLGFIMDPVNFLLGAAAAASIQDLCARFADWLEQMVEQLGRWTPVVHAKDIRIAGGEVSTPRAGRGLLDYGLFLRLLDRHQPQAPLILEHLQPSEVPQARAYLEGVMTASSPM
ncbi:MAG TPA: sugar phosphate isomerase/epimerase family protein [Gemmataceae bacterium]|nr:sugar phosphate isomerase/epimerase family protein [Gemmataceae bacterium]